MPVGSRPTGASSEGVHDLVGNAWEWTSTALEIGEAEVVSRPWDGSPQQALAVRGGAWNGEIVRVSNVVAFLAADYDSSIGFRCAAQ